MASMGHVPEQPADGRHRGETLAGCCWRWFAAALAGMLLAAVLPAGEAAGQPSVPSGLFRAVEGVAASATPDVRTASDSLTLRRRLISIDFDQLTLDAPVAGAARATGALSGVLRLNLFDDAVFTGLVERVAPTFSGGYSLSGQLAEVAMGTMTLVVNGDVVAGTVRTLASIYHIRPAGGGLHAVSQIDPTQLPPLGEPIPRQWREDDLPSIERERALPPRVR